MIEKKFFVNKIIASINSCLNNINKKIFVVDDLYELVISSNVAPILFGAFQTEVVWKAHRF